MSIRDGVAVIHIESRANGAQEALVDVADLDRVVDRRWYTAKRRGRFYVESGQRANGNHAALHRVVTNAPEDLQVDHINNDPLDNRRCNLRVVTQQENQWNRPTAKGYSWHKRSKKWTAYIRVDGALQQLGSFADEDDARSAYLAAKARLHVIQDRG